MAFAMLYVTMELMPFVTIICKCSCHVADTEILDVFTSFNNVSVEPVANKPPSIVIMGGSCSSRVAVANRLLGPDVLPMPHDNVPWHTLQFVDTDCVRSFSAVDTAGIKTLWSWYKNVPLADIELNSDSQNVQAAKVVLVSSTGSLRSEFTHTASVVNILMSQSLLRAGSQLVICSDEDYANVNSVQFTIANVIPVVIFVVSGDELSEQVCTADVLNTANCVGNCVCLFLIYVVCYFVLVVDIRCSHRSNAEALFSRGPLRFFLAMVWLFFYRVNSML